MKATTFVDKTGITRPIDAELRQWKPIEFVTHGYCDHARTICARCFSDWEEDFEIRTS